MGSGRARGGGVRVFGGEEGEGGERGENGGERDGEGGQQGKHVRPAPGANLATSLGPRGGTRPSDTPRLAWATWPLVWRTETESERESPPGDMGRLGSR